LNITDAELPVTNNILKYSRIALKVMDKNNILSDNIMSSGDFSLRKFGSHDNKEINQVIRLKDKRGQNGGKLILTGIVNSIVTIKTNDDESNNNRNSSNSSSSSKLTNERIGKIQLINCNLTHLSLSSNNNSGNIITNLMSKALSLTAPSSSSPLLLYCIIKIDKWTFRSNINSISSQSTSTLWSLKQTTSTMSVVSMAKTGIVVEIYQQQQQQQGTTKSTTANTTSAKTFDSNNYNDVLIGISTMKIDLLTMQSNTVVALKADLYKLNDKNREHCIGKIIMNGRYINDENIDESIFPEPQMIFGDENSNNLVTIDEFKMTEMINNDNNKSNSSNSNSKDNDQQLLFDQEHLEKTLRKEINTKINKEKQDILKILENKNKILQASLEKLNHELNLERKQNQLRDAILAKKTSASTSNDNDNGTKKSLFSSITNLKLPSNVKAWRNAHVQAWIQYQLELPQVRSGKCSCQ
jgi:hypothetical protein